MKRIYIRDVGREVFILKHMTRVKGKAYGGPMIACGGAGEWAEEWASHLQPSALHRDIYIYISIYLFMYTFGSYVHV
jgi:hypothetical protein